MKNQIANLPNYPQGWSDVSVWRSAREVPLSASENYIKDEGVPARQGGLTFTGSTVPGRNVELGEIFFAGQVLWRITGFKAFPAHLEIQAISVASLSDLIKLLPT